MSIYDGTKAVNVVPNAGSEEPLIIRQLNRTQTLIKECLETAHSIRVKVEKFADPTPEDGGDGIDKRSNTSTIEGTINNVNDGISLLWNDLKTINNKLRNVIGD